MSVEETIRKIVKEEFEAQTANVISRIDALEKEMKEKWGTVLTLRKNTLDQLQLEYRNLKDVSQESKDSNEDAEI